MKRLVWLALLLAAAVGVEDSRAQCVAASQVTIVGALRASNGLPSVNNNITLQPSQVGIIAGCGVNTMATTSCATSVDGTVVQTGNPLAATLTSTTLTGTLPSGTYYVTYAWYDALGHITLAAPETVQQLSAQGSLVVSAPAGGVPATAVGMKVYIGTSSGTETLQGATVGGASFNQSVPLASGAALPGTNNTSCVATANDSIWPVGTGYIVTMEDSSGNALPGYPMQWQLNGAGTTINLSNGLPYYHGVVFYPTPILAAPPAHTPQSISGPLNMSNYNIVNVGALGVGTNLPAWPIDVESGPVNASGGYIYDGGSGVATGNCLVADTDSFHTFRVPAQCLTASASQHIVTGSRAIGTCYTNSNGVPMKVYVTVAAPGTDSGTATANVGADCGSLLDVGAQSAVAAGASAVSAQLGFDVQVGWSYSVTRDASLVLSTWVENY